MDGQMKRLFPSDSTWRREIYTLGCQLQLSQNWDSPSPHIEMLGQGLQDLGKVKTNIYLHISHHSSEASWDR